MIIELLELGDWMATPQTVPSGPVYVFTIVCGESQPTSVGESG